MGKLLNEFVAQMETDQESLNIKDLMSVEEVEDWELLVKVLLDIDATHVAKDIKKISKFYNLKRWQEMSVLAFVKMLELMFMKSKPHLEALQESMEKMDSINPDISLDQDRMFG
jgi:hypothetical protein